MTNEDRALPLVTVCCLAYNHGKYIRECLDSLVKQDTSFTFEVLVHDDASKDETAEIIARFAEKYPSIVKPIYQTVNQYSKGEGILRPLILPLVRSKYIAICEGDDYWLDQMKLQKQVDFLEAHSDHGAIHSDYLELHETLGIFLHLKREGINKSGNIFRDMLTACSNYLVTGSLVLRTELVREAYAEIQKMPKFAMGDFPLVLHIASRSKIAYLDEVTCVYRILEESASHSSSVEKKINFRRSTISVIETFARFLPNSEEIVNHARENFHLNLLADCLRHPEIAVKYQSELNTWNFRGLGRLKLQFCCWLQGGLSAQFLAHVLAWRDRHKESRKLKTLAVTAPTQRS